MGLADKMEHPENLADIGRAFWKKAMLEREFSDAHDLARLAIAAKCLDDIHEDEELLRIEGRFIRDRFNRPIPHPAIRSLAENRTCFLRVINALGLDQVEEAGAQLKLY